MNRLTPEVFELRDSGLTLQEIADRFGVSRSAVGLYLSRTRTRFNHPHTDPPVKPEKPVVQLKPGEPSRQPKLTPEVFDLRNRGWKLREIAEKFGVTRVAVYHYLKRTRTRFNQPSVERTCNNCGKSSWYYKEQDPHTAYCSRDCYFESLKAHPYHPNRYGQRLGREEVEKHYGAIPEGAVVHHVDGDCTHNHKTNLVLFASQSDHLKHHRNCPHDPPLWSGVPLLCVH